MQLAFEWQTRSSGLIHNFKGEITGSPRPIEGRRKCSSRQSVSTREEPYVRENSRGEYRRESRGQRAVGQSESEGGGVNS